MKPAGTARKDSSIRIIGGQFKRSLLPIAIKDGLRPTPNRVRETLFNWLGQDLSGCCCVDAFAGTGALGFEAASRGAASVILIEQNKTVCRQLDAIKSKLNATSVSVFNGDALARMASLAAASQDVVFLDPPFNSELFLPALKAASRIIKPNGLIYLESDRAWLDTELEPLRLSLFKSGKAGLVHFHLWKPS